MVEMLLQASGYMVQTVTNGQEALECGERETPCVILLDMMMPVTVAHSHAGFARTRATTLRRRRSCS